MQKSFIAPALALAVSSFLGNGFLLAQTPATPPAAPAKTQSSTTSAKPKTATAAKTATPLTLKTQKEKFSYALGMSLGGNLHQQAVPLDPNIFARGVKDAMAGGKMLMTEQEARTVLMTVQNDVRQKEQAKLQAEGDANKKEGEAFLAANKSKEGVVVLPSGLQYKILTAGTGPKPAATDSVVCNYRGTSIAGAEFDSSAKHGGPATFPVTGVIKGWTEILQLMPVGSKWQVYVPGDLAYGDRGMPPDIQPGETLVFDVELVSIKPPDAAEEKKPEDKKPEDKKPEEKK
jgi:FKBP-type peptidyl-prolyl cis-trans isomerase FklB